MTREGAFPCMNRPVGTAALLLAVFLAPSAAARAQTFSPRPATLAPLTGAASPNAAVDGPQDEVGTTASLTTDADLPTQEHTGLHALFRNLGHDFAALPSVPNLWIAGVGGAAALAVHPLDDDVNERLQGAGDFFQAGELLGETGIQIGAAIGTYVIGRWKHSPKASHMGMDLLRAQIVAEALTQTMKLAVRRERPDGTNFAFPSGHAAVTLATATVIYRHLGVGWSLPVYGMAAYVAVSRLHDNRHWLSDVVFGAAVGAIAGRTVTRHGRSNYAWAPVYTPGGGVALLVTRVDPR